MTDKQNYFTYIDNTSDDNDKIMENLHKQAIIDGVDVSGCENYGETMAKTHNCTLYDEYLRPCKGADCYYKQLKRKEQECEELKKRLYVQAKEKVKYIFELDQLKAENRELKAVHSTNVALSDELFKYKTENDTLFKAIEEVNKINKRLKAEKEELKEFQKLLEEQMKFNKSELELSLSSEIKRSEFLLKEFKKADKQRDNWREKAEKLKQTLTEIKEIVGIGLVDGLQPEEYSGFLKILQAQILQKISEVEDV